MPSPNSPLSAGPAGPLAGPSAAEVRLLQAAAQWQQRRQEADWTGADEREFQAWLRADPAHAPAYDRISHIWTRLAQVPVLVTEPALVPPRAPRAVAPAEPATPPRRGAPVVASPGRRAFALRTGPALAAGVAVAAVGGAWWMYQETASFQASLRTADRQMKAVHLPDGSQVALNRDAAMDVRFFPRRREISLLHGEAYFEVAHDAARPFTVQHGAAQVRVLGTAFNVLAESASMVVKVASGRVEVRHDRQAPAMPIVLGPGQAVGVDLQTALAQSLQLAPESIGSWRTGQLVFRDAPLADVVAELSRYRQQPVRVESAELGRRRISGYAKTAAPDAFIRALPQLIAVRIELQPDGSLLLRDGTSSQRT